MAKFGVFTTQGGKSPILEYEGDYMEQDKEFVRILKRTTDPRVTDSQVAAIHLDKGQSVKKISD